MIWAAVSDAAAAHALLVMGALHPAKVGARGLARGTLILLGAGPEFWPAFSTSPERHDGAADPVDRWSRRLIDGLARRFGARALYPFGGPPHAPFIDWALKSGRAFHSPTGMLVHDVAGLMISYRGALHFADELDLPMDASQHPCRHCPDQPCTTACPVGALSATAAYDVGACHDFLDTAPGHACMSSGCAARRACPISQRFGRDPAQSALHMSAFHPA